jgi:signal transduction histidine kinase
VNCAKAKPRVIGGRKATGPNTSKVRRTAGLPRSVTQETGPTVTFEEEGSVFLFFTHGVTFVDRLDSRGVWTFMEQMLMGLRESKDLRADLPNPKVELEQILGSSPRNDLEKEVDELTLELATANEVLKVESDRCKLAEKALEESEKKHNKLWAEYNEIILNMQRQMEQVQKIEEVGKILTPALAHDLKNLLAAISSLAQLSIEKKKLPSPLDEHLQLIYENSQRANQLIGSFLDFVKIVKLDTPSYESIDIHDLINRMWKLVELNIGPRQVSFISRCDKTLPPLMGDRNKIERVFLNLLQNAAQAIPKKGIIAVVARLLSSENVMEVNIIDNGMGILKKDRKKLFKPFFTTKERGTGLGLSICHAIIQQHQGSITIESQKKQGTKVSIRLPVTIK